MGCAQWPVPVSTWAEGEGPESAPATLTVPGELHLLAVDDRRLPRYLLRSTTFTYELAPGERELQVRYDGVWASGSMSERRQPGTAIESEVIRLSWPMVAGADYRLGLKEAPATRRQALAFAQCPEIALWQDDEVVAVFQADEADCNGL